jgi:hypothetical protein
MTQTLYPQALADASVCIALANAPSRRYRFLLNGGCCRGQNGIVRSRDRSISLSLGVNEGLSIARFALAKRERKAASLFKLASDFFISLVLGPLNSLLWYVPSSRYIWSSVAILFLQEQIKDNHHHLLFMCLAMCMGLSAGRQYEEEGADASANARNAPSVPQRYPLASCLRWLKSSCVLAATLVSCIDRFLLT